MNNDLTDITVILDRSGSMGTIRQDTVCGFNIFVDDQKKEPGECKLSLIQFDHEYEENYIAKDIQEVDGLSVVTYVPRGSTALNDAIGTTINKIGNRFNKMDEEARPGKVVVVIITDGAENASRKFTKAQIKEMIDHQESVYNWEFIFLGANMDAIGEGAQYGAKFEKTMLWEASTSGISGTYDALSGKLSAYRAGAKFEFDASDRAKAVGQ